MHFAGGTEINARIAELNLQQIDFARYCRMQATAVRKRVERSKFPEINARMLAVAQRYERIADSVEQFLCRPAKPPAVDHVLVADRQLAEADAAGM